MAGEYYYLISSLPDISIAYEHAKAFPGFFEFCREQMKPADFKNLRKCFLFNDIQNVCKFKKEGDVYQSPSYYDKEDFLENLADPDRFLPFISGFFYDRSKEVKRFPGMPGIDELLWRFYETLDDIAGGFVRDYFLFELNLRNYCAALSLRTRGLEYKKKIIGSDYFSGQIAHSSAPDFGLGGEFSDFAPLLETFGKAGPLELEKTIEDIRFHWLDEAVSYRYFSAEAVCALAIKLNSAERWLKLDPEKGREILDEILARAKGSLKKAE